MLNTTYRLPTLLVLFMTGCAAPYWQESAAVQDYNPSQIAVVESEDPSTVCQAAANSVWGCSVRTRASEKCFVFIKKSLPAEAYSCTLRHEVRHCFGEHHDGMNHVTAYAVDCGDGEFYKPTQVVTR